MTSAVNGAVRPGRRPRRPPPPTSTSLLSRLIAWDVATSRRLHTAYARRFPSTLPLLVLEYSGHGIPWLGLPVVCLAVAVTAGVVDARRVLLPPGADGAPVCTVAFRAEPPAVRFVLPRLNELLDETAKADLLSLALGVVAIDDNGNLYYDSPFLAGRSAITADAVRRAGELAAAAGGAESEIVEFCEHPERFEFEVETTGVLAPKEVLTRAIGVLRDKVTTVAAHLAQVSQEGVDDPPLL